MEGVVFISFKIIRIDVNNIDIYSDSILYVIVEGNFIYVICF